MAEDCVNRAALLGKLDAQPCSTSNLPIHGHCEPHASKGPLAVYGTDAAAIRALQNESPAWKEQLHPDLPYTAAELIWAARHEMACTVEDVLARRTRALFLNAKAASAMAERAAELLAEELGRDAAWRREQITAFRAVAAGYNVPQ